MSNNINSLPSRPNSTNSWHVSIKTGNKHKVNQIWHLNNSKCTSFNFWTRANILNSQTKTATKSLMKKWRRMMDIVSLKILKWLPTWVKYLATNLKKTLWKLFKKAAGIRTRHFRCLEFSFRSRVHRFRHYNQYSKIRSIRELTDTLKLLTWIPEISKRAWLLCLKAHGKSLRSSSYKLLRSQKR